MTNLDRQLFQELVDLLTPYMAGEEERRTWLQLALGHTPLYHQINFKGPVNTFTVQMITTLLNYGEVAPGVEAVWALLDVLKTQLGGNRQQTITQMQSKLRPFFPPKRAMPIAPSQRTLVRRWTPRHRSHRQPQRAVFTLQGRPPRSMAM